MASDNPFDLVSGTAGLGAACDTVAVLRRMPLEDHGALAVTGRNCESHEIALSFSYPDWTILGPAAEVERSESRRAILDVLSESGPLTPAAIAEATGFNRSTVRYLLSQMRKSGEVRQLPNGSYEPAESGV